MTTLSDAQWMDRALALAERGRGRTSPNPMVGAVVVSPAGVVVGQGAHLEAGGPHAEVDALDMAGPYARGATLYCTLEPCSHTGRTGPCVERIVAAGIQRVVMATTDPNPRVNGAGVVYLRARGIEVVEGPGAEQARRQNAAFFTWVTRRRPFVILKMAVSSDGFVGRADARVRLTGADADRHFHRQRAEVDAIAVGSGTVLVDDPLLTPRGVHRPRPLVRVIADWSGRVPPSARVFSTLDVGPVIMVVSEAAAAREAGAMRELAARGITVLPVAERSVPDMLGRLADRDVVSLLVEGGPRLHEAFYEAGAVDRIHWIISPARLGHGVTLGPMAARRFQEDRQHGMPLGDDVLVECDVHGTD